MGYLRVFPAVLFLIFLAVPEVFPFEWPLSRVEIASTFAERRNGLFLKGVEIEGSREPVKPIEEGTLLFVAEEKPRHNGGLPSGLGNTVVVEHSRGIRSVYGYLGSVPAKPGSWNVKRNEVLSFVGNSGNTEGNLLYLQVIDSEFGQVVNPLLSLPSPDDTAPPFIGTVALEWSEGEGRSIKMSELGQGVGVSSGDYRVLIESYDLSENADFFRPMAPFSIRGYVNGEEKFGLRFEGISVDEFAHTLVDSGGVGVEELYRDRWIYRLGSFRLNSGDARIEIVVIDFAGNETTKTFQVTVR